MSWCQVHSLTHPCVSQNEISWVTSMTPTKQKQTKMPSFCSMHQCCCCSGVKSLLQTPECSESHSSEQSPVVCSLSPNHQAPAVWNHLAAPCFCPSFYLCQFFQIFFENFSLFKNHSFTPVAQRYMCVCVCVCVCVYMCVLYALNLENMYI